MFSRLPLHLKAIFALLASSIIWGISTPVIKYTLGYVDVNLYLYYRFLITCLVLLPFFLIKIKSRHIPHSDLARYILLGFLSTPVNLYLFFTGLKITTATDSTIISIITPVLVILCGAFLLKENITKREKIGIVITLAGTVLTIIQPFFEIDIASPKGNLWGNLLILSGALSGAIYVVLYRTKSFRHLDPFILTGIGFFVGLLTIYPLIFMSTQTIIPHPNAWPGILFMAIFGSCLAYSFYNYGVSKVEVSESSLYTYLQPVIAIPLSIIFLNEILTPVFVIGSIFILSGLIIAETRK